MVRTLNLALGLTCGLLLSGAEAQKPDPSVQPTRMSRGCPGCC